MRSILIGVGAIVGIALIAGAVLVPVYTRARTSAETENCMRNQSALARALFMYAQDNDRRLPIATGWQDSLTLYDPAAPSLHCPALEATAYTGYALSHDLGSVQLESIQDPSHAALVFDTVFMTRNAASDLSTLPRPGRHERGGRGNVVTGADGHVSFVVDDAGSSH